jgi:hypothetical protein
MRLAAHWLLGAAVIAAPLAAQTPRREAVDAAPPSDLSVTIYRDPDRAPDAPLDRDNPQGLAMISETRRVTLPKGESTIRFAGVAEGMIGISAIVTGLPGGTIEKNRNAELLSPAALVNGTLGNRVTITRTNPATGTPVSEDAIVRTRATGGLVLETSRGFEALRCSGLEETISFAHVPPGLSAQPVFSVDTNSPEGGTFDVTLTYLAWGFDWQASYVATLESPGFPRRTGEAFGLDVLSWLTLVNNNGQGFDKARLQVVAGKLNRATNYQRLVDPPQGEPLRLTCYPIGSTADGVPLPPEPLSIPPLAVPPPPPAPMLAMEADAVVVTGARMKANAVVTAKEEDLGDLKLFRVPERVDVSAKAMKQVAFLDKQGVTARYLYEANCDRYADWDDNPEPDPAAILLVTKNEAARGLGVALPQGAMTLYEPTARGDSLAGKATLRDYASGQDMELELGASGQVFARCAAISPSQTAAAPRGWTAMRATLANANPHPVTLRLQLAGPGVAVRFVKARVVVRNGMQVVEVTLPANQTQSFDWTLGTDQG